MKAKYCFAGVLWVRLSFLWMFSLIGLNLSAKLILSDLDFNQGQWTMVSISTYNYHPMPIQEELGSFKLSDPNILKQIQKKWDVQPFYEDHCEYHYVLKFYRGKELQKTLKINLFCNYITEDVFSYSFDPNWITEIRSAYQKMVWKNYRFNDLTVLRKAIQKAQMDSNTFLYHDFRPYLYDGFFIASSPHLDWNINRDSVVQAMKQKISERVGSNQFHVVPYLFYMNAEWKISFRFVVYCNEKEGKKYKSTDVTADWRHHLAYNQAGDQDIELMVIGADDNFKF